jgi:aryl-alcohol dehydrogenase-like predicted oxidoreductase
MTQATFSWMLLHSGMGPKDGLLLGASKVEHLEQNLACCSAATELHADILAVRYSSLGLCACICYVHASVLWVGKGR